MVLIRMEFHIHFQKQTESKQKKNSLRKVMETGFCCLYLESSK